MIDAILYVPDFPGLVDHLSSYHPELLERDDNGAMTQPPVITGFARTPAALCPDDVSLMAYARFRDHQAELWRGIPGVEVLAEAKYTEDGQETADLVYGALFSDPEAKAKYDSVYSSTPYEVDDGEGGTITVTPPERFGVMA